MQPFTLICAVSTRGEVQIGHAALLMDDDYLTLLYEHLAIADRAHRNGKTEDPCGLSAIQFYSRCRFGNIVGVDRVQFASHDWLLCVEPTGLIRLDIRPGDVTVFNSFVEIEDECTELYWGTYWGGRHYRVTTPTISREILASLKQGVDPRDLFPSVICGGLEGTL